MAKKGRDSKYKQRVMDVGELLEFAAKLTPAQLARLGLNVRADGSHSEHGRKM
jgi:hypothetical protein